MDSVGEELNANGLFTSYKRKRTTKKKRISRGEDEVLPNRFRSFSLCSCSLSVFCSIAFCCRVSRRIALFRGSSVYVRQHLRPVFLFRASKRTEIGICPPPCSLVSNPRPPIVGCNTLLCYLLAFLSIYSFVVSACVVVYTRSLCCRAVSLCDPRSRVIGSLSFSSLACSSVQDPRGPASFLHALA